MVCIYCGQKTQVINSRTQHRSNQVWRRRKCLSCKSVFTTEEKADYSSHWLIKTQNNGLLPFSRDKLLVSLYESLKHRKTALKDASALADTIIKKLAGNMRDGVVEMKTIEQHALVALNRFDKAAAVHYQAFHKS